MEKDTLMNRIAVQTDLNTEVMPRQSLIEIYGNNRLLIENHKGILEYSNEEIVVRLKFGLVRITGERLTIALMNKCRLVICGSIGSVHLCKEMGK